MRLPSFVAGLAALGERGTTLESGSLDARQDEVNKIGQVEGGQGEGLMFVLGQPSIGTMRMDPILASQPGDLAAHVHDIFGASNFRSVLNTPEEQARASCTPAAPQADMSNYWSPTLYFMYENGEFEAIPSGARSYYFGNTDKKADYITPFPRGMRVISGTAMTRHQTDIRRQFTHMDNHLGSSHIGTGMYLPNGTNTPTAPDNIRTFAYFPSCGWANQSLDSADHFSHLTWPIENGGGQGWFKAVGVRCPPTHPIKYPTLMLETNHYPTKKMRDAWRKDKENVILSNGDTVGTSYHADFVSGWDEDVLREAINTCFVGEDIRACPALAKSIVDTELSPCLHQGMQPAENVGVFSPIKQLPGANCRWGPEHGDIKPTCPSTPNPGWAYPNVAWISRSRTQQILLPAEIEPNQEMTEEALTAKYAKTLTGDAPYLRPCNEDGNESMEIIRNRKSITCGTNQDVLDNLNGATATNKVDVTVGMQDASMFTGIVPPNVVGNNAWRVDYDFPNDTCWVADSQADNHHDLCLADSEAIRTGSYLHGGPIANAAGTSVNTDSQATSPNAEKPADTPAAPSSSTTPEINNLVAPADDAIPPATNLVAPVDGVTPPAANNQAVPADNTTAESVAKPHAKPPKKCRPAKSRRARA